MSNSPRWWYGPLEDNKCWGCRLDPKKSRRELFQWIFALGIFWGGVSRYAAIPLIVALSPGHSDVTRFRPWSPIATGNQLDRAEKIPLTSPWYYEYISTHECGVTEYDAASFDRWVIALASNIISNNKFIEMLHFCRINTRDTQTYSSKGPDYWIVFFLRIALRFERLIFRVIRTIYTIRTFVTIFR